MLRSWVTRSANSAQSPGDFWRRSRAVGYQGAVSRPSIQRQSPRCGSRIQTGFPMAPARCAMHVSVVMTRSSVANREAVSARSRSMLDPSCTKTSRGKSASCPAASPFCSEIQVSPGVLNSGSRVSTRSDRNASALYRGLPAHARPTRGPLPKLGNWLSFSAAAPRLGSQVGAGPGNRLGGGAEYRGQAHQRALKIELQLLRRLRSQPRCLYQPCAHHCQRTHQPLHWLLDLQNRGASPCCYKCCVTAELNCVAQPLFGVQQYPPPFQRLALPARLLERPSV